MMHRIIKIDRKRTTSQKKHSIGKLLSIILMRAIWSSEVEKGCINATWRKNCRVHNINSLISIKIRYTVTLYYKHMRIYTLALILFCLTLAVLASGQIIQLTGETLEKHITSNPYTLVYMFPANCKQCLITDREFNNLAKQQYVNKTGIVLAKIDTSKEDSIAKQYGVQDSPLLMFFDETFVVKYEGQSTASGILTWIKEYLNERVHDLDVASETMVKPYVLLEGAKDNQVKVLNKAMYGLDNVKAYSTKQGPTRITLQLRNKALQYSGQLERIQLNQWLNSNLHPSITSLKTKKIIDQILFNPSNKPILMLILSKEDRKNAQKFEMLQDVCEELSEKIWCGEVLPHYVSHKGAHGYFKVKDMASSIVGLVRSNMNIAHRMNMPYSVINKQSLKKFVEQALSDSIQRIVDNVAPEQVSFKHAQSPSSAQQLRSIIDQNHYVFVNFYDPTDNVSLFFSKPYDAFAKIVESEEELKDVKIVAVDCGRLGEYCAERKFGYYPVLELYVWGTAVGYEKTQKLPQVPDLIKFVHSRVANKVRILGKDQDLKSIKSPFVIIHSTTIPKNLQALPALTLLSVYHTQTAHTTIKIELHSADQVKQYTSKLQVSQVAKWIKEETELALADMFAEQPDQRISKAVEKKKPIIFILDSDSDRTKAKEYKIKLGSISKSLGVCGAYANSQNRAYQSLLHWVKTQHTDHSRVVYADTKNEKLYIYPHSLESMTLQSVRNFIAGIKSKKARAQGEAEKQVKEMQENVENPQLIEL